MLDSPFKLNNLWLRVTYLLGLNFYEYIFILSLVLICLTLIHKKEFFFFLFFFSLDYFGNNFCFYHLSICCITSKFYTFKHHCSCQSCDSFSKKNTDSMVIWSFFVYIFFFPLLFYVIKTSIVILATLFFTILKSW